MQKIIGLILVLAVIWAVPAFRAQVSGAALPALDRMGPRGESVATPLRVGIAKARVSGIVRMVASDYADRRGLPDERDFQRWLRARTSAERSIDPWGNPYWMERTREGLRVGSSGPDGRRGTGDDVTHSLPL